jgi:Fe-S cluster biogenesis protein NfuA
MDDPRVDPTPNPAVYRFSAPSPWWEGDPVEILRGAPTHEAPLARLLFEDPRVQAVLIGRDFVSVTASPSAWRPGLIAGMQARIVDLLEQGEPVLLGGDEQPTGDRGDPELVYKIETVLDWDIRPGIAAHGGDVRLVRVDEGVVQLDLRGACTSCPSSRLTLENDIEERLLRSLPELRSVVQVGG